MAEATTLAPPAFTDNPHSPTVFAEEAFSFLILNGNVHITLTTLQSDNAGGPGRRVVIGRLVLPMRGAQGLSAGLYDFLAQRGFDPVLKPTDPQQVQ